MNKYNISKLELILISTFSILLGIALSTIPGKEAHTDVLWYLNMAFNNIADPHWMSRYTHVYLQKIFLSFSDSPFQGLVNFWAFLISATVFLIYINSRLISDKINFIHSGLSILMFLSIPLLGPTAGVALIDYTAMLLVLIIIMLYQFSFFNNHSKQYLLILIGIFLYFALLTKETALISGVVLLGLGFDDKEQLNLKKGLRLILKVFYGFILGAKS